LIARNEYAEALEVALPALHLLHVELPAHPAEADVGAELGAARKALAAIGAEGLRKLDVATDPVAVGAMRILSRVSSAAYFARPMLLPVLACRLVTMSTASGLNVATPYALSIYGIVLNSIGLLNEAHGWGEVALELLERFDDRS